jgi:hypothetical protein
MGIYKCQLFSAGYSASEPEGLTEDAANRAAKVLFSDDFNFLIAQRKNPRRLIILTGPRREELLYPEDFVLLVKEDDLRRVAFQLAVLAIVVAEDDDLVSHNAFSGGGAVQADLA